MEGLQWTKELIAKKILPEGTEVLGRLQGGTVSELYLLGTKDSPRFVLKSNDPAVIESEASFLELYRKAELLPELLYKDTENEYMIYGYLSGKVLKVLDNKRAVLASVVLRLINQYIEISSHEQWGWKDEPVSTWQKFISSRAAEAALTLVDHVDDGDGELVASLIKESAMNTRKRAFLLHGDCGIHNFLIQEGELTGVIDPTPVIGPPLYDLLYAFCSSPEDLTSETIQYCTSLMAFDNNLTNDELYREVLIILYIRLATCLKHHPQDFEQYLNGWAYWKAKVCEKELEGL